MRDARAEAVLTSAIDQGGMAIREFVKNSRADDIFKLLEQLIEMSRSDDTGRVFTGTLCSYALAIALRDESAASREREFPYESR
jgi:hypothetical protein